MARTNPPRWAVVSLVAALTAFAGRPALAQSQDDSSVRYVRSLDIVGVEHVDLGDLRDRLRTRVSGRLPVIGRDHVFSREAFQQDLYRIVAYLSDHGFPRARVTHVEIRRPPDSNGVHLTVHVEQGEPVMVDRVELFGFDVLADEAYDAVEQRLQVEAGERRMQEDVRASRAAALAVLEERGYAHAAVDVLEGEGRTPGSVALVLVADPGPLTRIGPITVRGNGSVSDGRVKSLLEFEEGDVFKLSELLASQRTLYNREIFQFVTIGPPPGHERSAVMPIDVTLTQGKPRRVSFAPGYGSEEQARISGTIRHLNVFGGARTAQIQGKWSSLDRGARASFEEPTLFRRGLLMSSSLQYWYADEPAYSLLTSGGRVTLAREFSRSDPVTRVQALTTVSMSFVNEYEDYTISDAALQDLSFRDELIALGLDPTRGAGRGTLVAVSFDLQRNTAPSLVDARRGYLVQLHVEQAGQWLPGDFNYREYDAEGRVYRTLGPVVLAGRLHGATLDAPGALPGNVPFFKRYFLGGASSLRGWGRFEVSPLSGSGLPIGGHSMLASTLEARVPLVGSFATVVFVDAGNAWSDSFEVHLDDLRYTLGSGLRYHTPIGPIRFDFGYQLTPIAGLLVEGAPQPRRWRVHFSLGQAF